MSEIRLSYAITVCNELEEVRRLLDLLLNIKREQDEIVVLMDITKANEELISTLRQYEMHNMDHMVVWPGEFAGHFADWKNKLSDLCNGDYIFQIDADEVPNTSLIEALPEILESNDGLDVYLVPRINTVDGITQYHINKWNWNIDVNGFINFPDYQYRIYKNAPHIQWVNKVHERLNGYKTFSYLPAIPEYCLIHHKSIERQERQNELYDTI